MWMQKQSRYENMAYVALWGLLFAAPLLSLYVRTTGDDGMAFDWQEAFMVWRRLAVFLLIFLVHNFVLAPLLIHRQKRWQYALLTVCMIGLFAFYQCQQRPPMGLGFNHEPPPFEHREDFPKHLEDGPRHPDHFPKHHRDVPPAIIGEHDIIAIVILILMLGANLGIKGYFKTREDQKKLLRLEKENLEQQLEYLKYQINPHFFMNTLNNIHALPLTREFGFIRNYITLMRLRYTDKVQISINLPEQSPDLMIPPLMLITFIENAFKHGVSYQHDSFIEVKAEVQGDTLHFSCRNSKAEKPNEEKGGVGLANVKQRLKLLYDNDYSLKIQDDSDIYSVQLTIPLS